MKNYMVSKVILRWSLLFLIFALLMGLYGAYIYIFGSVHSILSFRQCRPLHVSAAVFWILSAALGSVMYFCSSLVSSKMPFGFLWRLFQWLWVGTIIAIFLCFLFAKFGGREYWEFPPILSVPLLIAWLLASVNFFAIIKRINKPYPVYVWMWASGFIFFGIAFLESNLWLIPWFRSNIIRDITIQWKANGSIVGSWNMLIYGTSIYLMEKISGNKKMAYQNRSFLFYFLGLTNLMFNWGHHTYILPAALWVQHISYAISMTEWIVLISIFRSFRIKLQEANKYLFNIPYRFLLASEIWLLLNLILAIFMSIPYFNSFSHGTHITVAHAMGTTIGINSMILMGSIFYIIEENASEVLKRHRKWIIFLWYIVNISLLVFWLALILAGLIKGLAGPEQISTQFSQINAKIVPYLTWFYIAGFGVALALGSLALMAFKILRLNFKVPPNKI